MFNAGMQFALFERIFDLGAAHGVRWEALSVELDNWYALHGSFFRGDARGSVRPSEISIRARTSAPHELACSLLRASVLASVAEAYFRTPLVNTFSLFLNGRRIVTAKARDPGLPEVDDPHLRIERVAGEGPAGGRRDAIVKIAAANIAPTPLGGTPTNLNPEQHRDIQVCGSCSALLPGAFAQATNNLHPNGSTFRYLSAASSPEVPASVAYLAAGLGFCYMTQLHRYAVIAKVPLSAVRLVQFMPFAESGRATAFDLRVDVAPVDTTVFTEGNASVDQVLRMLAVSQQTCFLHGALHGSFPSKVRAVINDRPVDIAT